MTPNDRNAQIDRYLDLMAEKRFCSSRSNWANYLEYLFDRTDFRDKRVLDIGGGIGLISFYAAAAGAKRVICLEPEAAGGKEGMNRDFEDFRDRAELPNVELVSGTFQEYESDRAAFDTVILHNSINHLDEDACTRLHKDQAARDIFIAQFRRMYDMMAPGGDLVVTDCSRHNFFGLFGRRSPFAKAITWSLHQSPAMWAKTLEQAGFTQPRIRWTVFNRLSPLAALFLRNEVAAYFLTSRFSLTMRKPS